MAIPFLNHLDLRSVSELRNAILHLTTESSASDVEGKIIYDTGTDTIKFYNGTEWISLGGDTVRAVSVDTNGDGSVNNTLEASETLVLKKGSNITLSEANGVVTIAATDTDTQLSTEQVQDIVGAMFSGNTETRISATYEDGDGTIDLVVDDMTADTNTQRSAGVGLSLNGNALDVNVGATGTTQAPESISNTANRLYQIETDDQDNLVVNVPWSDTNTNTDTLQSIAAATDSDDKFVTFVENATGAQTGMSGANFKFNPGLNGGTLYVPNIVVSGDTTTASETVKIIENNTLQFEGAAGSGADDELNLTTATLTDDHTQTLQNATGTIALLSDITGTNSGTNTGDQNLFSAIAVSGQSSVIADTTSDTLTLVAGSNVSITTAAGSDTITIASTDTNTQLSTEQVQDIVGAMFSGNTETRISATYEDGDGTIDLVVDDMTANTNTQLSTAAALIDVSVMDDTSSNRTASFTHGLSSQNLIVQMYDTVTGQVVYADIDHTSTSAISITFASIPTNDIRVVVIDAKNGLTDKTVSYS